MIEIAHQSDPMEPDDDGFVTARCTCGWTWGPCPDQEVVTDVLMAHAAERAAAEANS